MFGDTKQPATQQSSFFTALRKWNFLLLNLEAMPRSIIWVQRNDDFFSTHRQVLLRGFFRSASSSVAYCKQSAREVDDGFVEVRLPLLANPWMRGDAGVCGCLPEKDTQKDTQLVISPKSAQAPKGLDRRESIRA